MANTYTLISSNVLSSSAATVTFSAIPATYTDLVLRFSARTGDPAVDYFTTVRYNGDTATNYSTTRITGNGATAVSSNTSFSSAYNGTIPGAGATSNTFGSVEMYIPNYLISATKPFSVFSTMENNATTSYINAIASQWRNNAAITSITITDASTNGFVSGSSFYLYGIKNS